jgi:hypothetical protein
MKTIIIMSATFLMAIGVAAWAGASAQKEAKQSGCSKAACTDKCDKSCCDWDGCPLK